MGGGPFVDLLSREIIKKDEEDKEMEPEPSEKQTTTVQLSKR